MDIYSVIDNYLGKKPVPGAFPQKPDGFLSIYKLLSSGLIPNDNTLIEMFAMPSNPSMGYFYADSSTCRKMVPEEITVFNQKKARPVAQKPLFGNAKYPQKESTAPSYPPMYPDFKSLQGKKIVCFDTETTGIAKDDEILQLTAVEFDDGGEVQVKYQSYFRPMFHNSWENAQKVNGISPFMVRNAPYFFEKIPILADIFQKADVIVGYNVQFDARMVAQSSSEALILPEKKLCDPMVYFKTHKKEKGHKLIDACEKYLPEELGWFEEHAHDASADAIMTLKVLKEMGIREGIDISKGEGFER